MKKFLATAAIVILIFFNLTAQNKDRDSLGGKGRSDHNKFITIPIIIGIAIPIIVGILMGMGKWNENRNKKGQA